jgi:hypothetical protein
MTALATDFVSVLDELRAALGDAQVVTDLAERAFYSSDVYRQVEPALAVLRPPSVDALAAAVRIATSAGHPIVARGGGMSYTDAYLPTSAHALMLDMSALDAIIEINETDRYVTVECGVTWAKLYAELDARGLRTPYWGPLSGLRATVGGALSQGSIFLGSARFGSIGDTVIGLEVIAANGELLKTGSAAGANAAPFLRYFGPDLTGLFVGDAGALGIKARATLKLLPKFAELEGLSFACDSAESLCAAMGEVARSGLASECFGFDPFLQSQRMKRASLLADVKTLGKVMQSGGSLLGALKEGARLVATGRNFLDDVRYSLHLTVEAHSRDELNANLATLRRLLKPHAREVENAVPKVLRADPFVPPNSMLGPSGERWVPVHGIVPLSQAAQAWAAVQALFARHTSAMQALKVEAGYLVTTIGSNAFLLEPVFYWPDVQLDFHKRLVEPGYLKKLTDFPENLAARALVDELKHALKALFQSLGATHFQLGKFYHYRQGRNPASLKLLDALKHALDPRGLINPGALTE